jgi:hypothetical protein
VNAVQPDRLSELFDNTSLKEIVECVGPNESLTIKIAREKGVEITVERQSKTNIPTGLGPYEVLKAAIKAVPAVKYALAVGGIVAVIVIVKGWKIDFRIAIFGVVIMLVLMTAVVIFARLAKESASTFRKPAIVFMWFAVILTMASALAVFLSFFVGWPADWRDGHKSNIEKWQTVEGEVANQFTNLWEVRFDGKPFSCPPSPTYGQTLCTASASGNERTVKRFLTIDNNPCTFEGTVNDNIITGTYSCTRIKGPFDWHATIIH